MNYTAEQQAEHRAKWVGALRSNRFTQTHNQLVETEVVERNGGERDRPIKWKRVGHCCLAVAVEVAIEEGCPLVRVAKDGSNYDYAMPLTEAEADDMLYNEDESFVHDGVIYVWMEHDEGNLPYPVAAWLGIDQDGSLTSDASRTVRPQAHTNCIGLNDDMQWNFNQIASAVEFGKIRVEGQS